MLFFYSFFSVIIYPITIFLFVNFTFISAMFACCLELCVCSVSPLEHVDGPVLMCVCVCVCVMCVVLFYLQVLDSVLTVDLRSVFEDIREITHFAITLHYFGITNLRGYHYKFATTCSSSKAVVSPHAD